MRKMITIFLWLYAYSAYSQVQNEISTGGLHHAQLSFSVGSIYMEGQIESGLIAQVLADSVIVNVKDHEAINAKVFPNPANNFIAVVYNKLPKSLKVYNSEGRWVSTKIHNEGSIDISDLKTGLYFIKINEKTSLAFIKQ